MICILINRRNGKKYKFMLKEVELIWLLSFPKYQTRITSYTYGGIRAE